nr:uncharacterized protein LOC128684554 [Cherax quadricarinatus]
MWRNSYVCVVVIVGMVWAVSGEVNSIHTHSDYNINSGNARLREIQTRFLDVIGNSTSSMFTISELMSLLYTDTGGELGKLLLEGVMLGVQEKDAITLLTHFWAELQLRLSPVLMETLNDYRDFFAGMDITTLPLVWEQLFRKDELGNSLAEVPLGQLIDMIQPSASKYGVDIRAFVNSLMGKGDNNARDLIFTIINNLDVSSMVNSFLNSTSSPTAVQAKKTDHSTIVKPRPSNEEKTKKEKDKILQLFKPLVASLLRENNVDLDVDAVLKVLSPLLSVDMMAQAAPLLTMLGSQAGEGIAPVIASILGGGDDRKKQQQMGGLLGGLGTLLAGGGKNNMDLDVMMNIASVFMNSGKPSKNKKRDKKEKSSNSGFNMDLLMNLAGNLAAKNDINLGSILAATSSFLAPDIKKEKQMDMKKMQQSIQVSTGEKQKTAKETVNDSQLNEKPKAIHKPNTTLRKNKSKNLIDVIEPILLLMQTDKKCNSKIKDAISLSKSMLNNKISGMGDVSQLLPYIISSLVGGDTEGLGMDSMLATMKQAMAYASWDDFLQKLNNEDYRESLILNITPYLSELLALLATQDVQNRLYDVAVPKIETFLTSYGLPGVTLNNFPERVAPLVGMLGKSWNLPFKPTIILVPLRDYLKGLQSWAGTGLAHIRTLSTRHVEAEVKASLNEVFEAVVEVAATTRGATPSCLPQLLCRRNSGFKPDSLRAAVTRAVSVFLASGPLLEQSDSTLLVLTIQAISGSYDHCEEAFPGDCIYETQDDDDDDDMNLDYEHQEL